MEIFDMAPRDKFKPGTKPVAVEIVSEPYIIVTRRGYAPMITIRVNNTMVEQALLIGSVSITNALEELRAKNNGSLKGLKFEISKESADQMAKYIVKPVA